MYYCPNCGEQTVTSERGALCKPCGEYEGEARQEYLGTTEEGRYELLGLNDLSSDFELDDYDEFST